MQGKTVLVTGANSGMGRAACAMLADMGAQVAMLCRTAKRSRDMDVAARLFGLSEQICGVRLDDVIKG